MKTEVRDMCKNEYIVMVGAGMKENKKDFMNDYENIYLNYGLLGLATLLHDKGYVNTKVFQGDNKNAKDVINEIAYSGIEIKSIHSMIFVSIPSFFAITWAIEFIELIKSINNSLKIVVGGRWVIDSNLNWMITKIPKADFFCKGCPDESIEKILNHNNWDELKNKNFTTKKSFDKLNYQLLNNFQQYQPCIEICRGCGRQCDFCLEKNYPLSEIKSAKQAVLEVMDICKVYKNTKLNFYFQASIFNPSPRWSLEFLDCYIKTGAEFSWRFETRVDSINPDSIEILSKAGLKVVDLGLESASKRQLLSMGKTKNPDEYLRKAKILLQKMGTLGIWAKLNILLYLGETNETIAETLEWLDGNKTNFKGVSVNPFILYLDGSNTEQFLHTILDMTGSKPNVDDLYEMGFSFVNLSPEISTSQAKSISKMISDRYMSQEDYFDLKKYSYKKLLG